MKKVIRLTESDLVRIVKRVISEQTEPLTGESLTKFYNAMIANYEKDKSFEGMTIFSTLLNNRDKNIPVKQLQDYVNKTTGEELDFMGIYNGLTNKEVLAVKGQNIKRK